MSALQTLAIPQSGVCRLSANLNKQRCAWPFSKTLFYTLNPLQLVQHERGCRTGVKHIPLTEENGSKGKNEMMCVMKENFSVCEDKSAEMRELIFTLPVISSADQVEASSWAVSKRIDPPRWLYQGGVSTASCFTLLFVLCGLRGIMDMWEKYWQGRRLAYWESVRIDYLVRLQVKKNRDVWKRKIRKKEKKNC